ncbi:DNA-directed RNA polymerase subunit omega [bacterium]|nr:DNA-directed RNA polymerase subunit omega [bacterium]
MVSPKKYIITQRGAMEDKSGLFTPPLRGLTKYEIVLLISRRARSLNQMRIDLQKKYRVHLIEKVKPTIVSLKEYFNDEFKPTYEPKEEQ